MIYLTMLLTAETRDFWHETLGLLVNEAFERIQEEDMMIEYEVLAFVQEN
jgi:hypothetical protein